MCAGGECKLPTPRELGPLCRLFSLDLYWVLRMDRGKAGTEESLPHWYRPEG